MIAISCVTVDCASPSRLAEFWAEALGWRIAHVSDDGAYCVPAGGGSGLEFIRVAEPKTTKNRVHLGTHTADVDAEVERQPRCKRRVGRGASAGVALPQRRAPRSGGKRVLRR